MGCWQSSQRHLEAWKGRTVRQQVAAEAAYTNVEGLVTAVRAAHPLAALCRGLPVLQVYGCPQFAVLHPETLRLPGKEIAADAVGGCGGAGPR